jgi:cobalt-zinc-cadmium resistance protein CzcA
MRVQELIGGVKADVGIKIFGDDLSTLTGLARQVARVAGNTTGAADIRIEATTGLNLLTLEPDLRRTGQLGVEPSEFAAFVETLRVGRPVGRLIERERRFDIVMRTATPPFADDGPMQRVRMPAGDHAVLVGDIARVSSEQGPAQISREQGRRRILVEANVRGRDLLSFVQELQQNLKRLELPVGYWLEYGGEYENLASAGARFAIVVPLTLLAVLLMLYFAFGAWRPALLIFVNVPAAATGGVLALALRGLELSVSSAVGFLALFGVATLNALVLLSAARHRQQSGEAREDAIVNAATERVRPVLVTALVAALGFLPMALATGTGAEVQRPLATVVIGGLVTASLVTLFALPALYGRFASPTEAV